MSGEHKLYQLDKKVAQGAIKGLRECNQMPLNFLNHMKRGPSTARTSATRCPAQPCEDFRSTTQRSTDNGADQLEQVLINEAIALSLAESSGSEHAQVRILFVDHKFPIH